MLYTVEIYNDITLQSESREGWSVVEMKMKLKIL